MKRLSEVDFNNIFKSGRKLILYYNGEVVANGFVDKLGEIIKKYSCGKVIDEYKYKDSYIVKVVE